MKDAASPTQPCSTVQSNQGPEILHTRSPQALASGPTQLIQRQADKWRRAPRRAGSHTRFRMSLTHFVARSCSNRRSLRWRSGIVAADIRISCLDTKPLNRVLESTFKPHHRIDHPVLQLRPLGLRRPPPPAGQCTCGSRFGLGAPASRAGRRRPLRSLTSCLAAPFFCTFRSRSSPPDLRLKSVEQ